jgi:hypothetical protein
MQVLVKEVFPHPGGTVWVAEGIDTITGRTVQFAGDWRPMRDIFEAVHGEGRDDVVTEVPDWAVLGGELN